MAVVKGMYSPVYGISRHDLYLRLQPCATGKITLLDEDYRYTSHATWRKLIPDLLAEMPPYTPDTFDCDNFAFTAASRASERHMLNSLGVAYLACAGHMLNCYLADNGLYWLEPQTGEEWRQDKFRAAEIVMG